MFLAPRAEEYSDIPRPGRYREMTVFSSRRVIHKDLCLRYQEQIMPWSAVELRCGMCLAVCPVGKRPFKIPPKSRPKKVREMKYRWAGAKW